MTTLLWLQALGCGGCTMSLLYSESPGLPDLLSDAGISLRWHPALSLGSRRSPCWKKSPWDAFRWISPVSRAPSPAARLAPGDSRCRIGAQTVGDCSVKPWDGEGRCTKGGYPCINCTAPQFEDPAQALAETPKVAGIPVRLPTGMPKARFMTLASLSKAATPERIATNAQADRVVVPPTLRTPR